LRKHPIFSDLAPEALDQLCRYAKHTSLKRGATIFSKGDPGDSLFAIISGTVKISISSSEGRNAILNLIGAGEMVGEIAVLAGKGRTADVIANTDCEILVIDRRDFLPFVRSQPALAMKFIELLCERLRHTSEQVEQLILLDLPGRLASALLGLTEGRKLDPHYPAGDRRDGRHDAREHQQAVGRLGRAQMGSARARRHRRARCQFASGTRRGWIGQREKAIVRGSVIQRSFLFWRFNRLSHPAFSP
jgi:CRP-like cAMP-binding protein